MNLNKNLLEGRLDRKNYIIYSLLIVALSTVAYKLSHTGDNLAFPIGNMVMLFCSLVFLAITIRRLHDVGITGFLSIILFFPIINFLLIIFLFVKKTKLTDNKYFTK